MSKVVSDRMVKSFLDLFVLSLLNGGSKHGYEIMQDLRTKTGTRIGAGTLYPYYANSKSGNSSRPNGYHRRDETEESTRSRTRVRDIAVRGLRE